MYWIVTDLNVIVTIWFTLVMEDGVQAQKAQGSGRRGGDVTPVKVPAPAGSVHDWGETLEQGTKPPTAPRALHSRLPTAPLGWVKCREHISLLIILCIILYVTNKAHLSLSLFVCCLLFAAVGVWPSEARKTGRHPARKSGMTCMWREI